MRDVMHDAMRSMYEKHDVMRSERWLADVGIVIKTSIRCTVALYEGLTRLSWQNLLDHSFRELDPFKAGSILAQCLSILTNSVKSLGPDFDQKLKENYHPFSDGPQLEWCRDQAKSVITTLHRI
jgi:hypothetical protein